MTKRSKQKMSKEKKILTGLDSAIYEAETKLAQTEFFAIRLKSTVEKFKRLRAAGRALAWRGGNAELADYLNRTVLDLDGYLAYP